jgi:hypothetical protein
MVGGGLRGVQMCVFDGRGGSHNGKIVFLGGPKMHF